ncbi:hypothetical protein H7E67_10735 [Clostridium gasigenes]|uniref:hypothetical protein n=1 Tax=Clostridium gasigenes TaxID=94869 RepID=UPI0014383171|nr:hypothetical protein [Clostridium gasigenes]MBB6623902.1 hypothetical protein [Clostridium gasigenes]NKF05423.1 hypothetical protein [Clostridium gasigenes]QSW18869.1 hypothetical protein J1C67_15180 [Clostridium gasigenes]
MKKDFIDKTNNKSKITYQRKLSVFIEFLENECGVSSQNYKETLKGIDDDKILKSIVYYVHKYGVKYKCTIDNFYSVIKQFFAYIGKDEGIKNNIFDSKIEVVKLNKQVDDKCKELKLNQTDLKEIMGEEEFSSLLKACNESINKYSVSNYETENSHKKIAGLFISAVIIKLVMYTGIKNIVIPTILKNDYDSELNKISINGVTLDLPDNLAYDLKKYAELRSAILRKNGRLTNDNEYSQFFITQKGEYMSKPESSEIYKLMGEKLGTTEGESLCKYVIMKQIEEGIEVLDIINLTRNSFDACMHCKEELTLLVDKQRSDTITLKLRGSKLYNIL